MRSTRTIAAVTLAGFALAGCATTEPAAVLAGGPRMIDLYRGAASEPWPSEGGVSESARPVEPSPEAPAAPVALERDASAERDAPEGAVVEATCRWWGLRWPCEAPAPPRAPACACGDAPGYTRTAANELELLFPRLPNPDIYIYVPAHLATELRIPVPGYTTAVPLYDRVEYALPGEGAAARGPGASPEEAEPGADPEEARSDANPEEEQRGVISEEATPEENPEEGQLGASSEEPPPGVSPEEAQSGASAEEARAGATPEDTRRGASPEEAGSGADPDVWLGASPVKVPPGASPKDGGPDAGMEEGP